MIIILNKGYFVDVDKLNYTLKKKVTMKKKATGESYEGESIIGYYGDMEHLIENYMKLVHYDKNKTKVMEMKDYVESIDKSNKDALKGLKKVLSNYEVK